MRVKVYLISFELNFMRSFSQQYRFRGADITITPKKDFNVEPSDSEPSIRNIFPTVLAVDVSEGEIRESTEVTTGAGVSGGPGKLNASVKLTDQDKTSFKGERSFMALSK